MALNKKLLAIALAGIALVLSACNPAAAENVRFACGSATLSPPTSEAKADYRPGEVIVVESVAGDVAWAVRITGEPVSTYRGSGQAYARETRYPCQRIDAAAIPAHLRWPGRRR